MSEPENDPASMRNGLCVGRVGSCGSQVGQAAGECLLPSRGGMASGRSWAVHSVRTDERWVPGEDQGFLKDCFFSP